MVDHAALAANSSGPARALEMWGGVECTVNRVRDTYFDQLERSDHVRRRGDLPAIASLGLSAIRYPLLWERTQPDEREAIDWSWCDERVQELRDHGIRPIAGLVHHGSGPRFTSLIDPAFPDKLARYARAVAERYPWITDYTPVNEPLTTARFSGLYGFWYPHGLDDATFARAIVTQCRGIVCAMRAIREVTPHARLVQTEDLGRVYATPQLREIARFRNERRWLSLDLLCGKVGPEHALWKYLLDNSVSAEELDFFRERPCPPDIVGVNHYLTSDRFIDESKRRYPRRLHECEPPGFAEVEAVRARLDLPIGVCTVLHDAWRRYQLPLAVTEAHLCATREEQLRWLYEAWTSAERLRQCQVDVRAVTAWSMFGAFDWNVLVMREDGFYEPGLFDLRAPAPRPTALARLVRDLAVTGRPRRSDDALLSQPGWWRRPDRLFRAPGEGRSTSQTQTTPTLDMQDRSTRPLLILGGTGSLGRTFVRLCDARSIPYHLLGRDQLDLAQPLTAEQLLYEKNPWAVVNAAGYTRIDDAEHEPERVLAVNALGPAQLALACAKQHIPMLVFSSDLVFDGAHGERPYTESCAVAPLNAYGLSKVAMEARVLAAHPGALIVRTSALFGAWDETNFVVRSLRALQRDGSVSAVDDHVISPTYLPDLVHAALDLLIDGESGLWHLANVGEISWSGLARLAAELAGLRPEAVLGTSMRELGLVARRPRYSALASERAWIMPRLEDALARCVSEIDWHEERRPRPEAVASTRSREVRHDTCKQAHDVSRPSFYPTRASHR